MARCTAQTKKGARCRMNAQRDSKWCCTHDPSRKKEQKEAQVAGGRARAARTLEPKTPPPSLRTVDDALELLEGTIHQIRTGAIDRAVGNAVVQAVNVARPFIMAASGAGESELPEARLPRSGTDAREFLRERLGRDYGGTN